MVVYDSRNCKLGKLLCDWTVARDFFPNDIWAHDPNIVQLVRSFLKNDPFHVQIVDLLEITLTIITTRSIFEKISMTISTNLRKNGSKELTKMYT